MRQHAAAIIFLVLFISASAPVQSAGLVVFDDTDTAIGFYAGPDYVSPAGYRFRVNQRTGELDNLWTNQTLYYETMNCSGQAYVSFDSDSDWSGAVFLAEIHTSPDPAPYYVPSAEPRTARQMNSRSVSNSCLMFGAPLGRMAAPAFPNDVGVTDVESAGYTLPLRIEVVDVVTNCLFEDGFECTLIGR